MESEYIDLPVKKAKAILPDLLELPKAREFAFVVDRIENSQLISCLVVEESDGRLLNEGDEIIIFDTSVDVSQRPLYDIRYSERVAILFTKADIYMPFVFALRNSFPKVLHLISTYADYPTCLCISESLYADLKLEWRSQQFLQDIRTWLALTAEGKLHQDDQPLEPFIIGSQGVLILPPDIRPEDVLYINQVNQRGTTRNFIADRVGNPTAKPFLFIFLKGEPQVHGILDFSPFNLAELHEFLLRAGIDLYAHLQIRLRNQPLEEKLLSGNLMLFVQLPKRRNEGPVTEFDNYAFLSHDDSKTIGLALNVYAKSPEGLGYIVPPEQPDVQKTKLSVISILTPVFRLNKVSAKLFSGNEQKDNSGISIVQIGLGALGSQLFINLAKTGFGNWGLIDEDILYPHNTVRHFLSDKYIGWSKSWAMAEEANRLFGVLGSVTGIWDNYLRPADKKSLDQELKEAEIILDVSTSISVARDLAFRRDLKGRRISMFLNPSGNDLVILAEDVCRNYTLDILEFQYYRSLINEVSLEGHFQKTSSIRYSNSCRDITSRIPQDYVALHSAIASDRIKKLAVSGKAEIKIWRIGADMSVKSVDVPVSDYLIVQKEGWTVYIDQFLVEKMSRAREEKLPNETGGVLIGGYDFERRRIYLVDSILSPIDSEETPISFIRGIEGVRERLKEIGESTASHLVFTGEWHSHPKECSLEMSVDDIELLNEISVEMNAIGFPPLMLIIGDDGKFYIHMEVD